MYLSYTKLLEREKSSNDGISRQALNLALLYAPLGFTGHLLMENRNGMIVDGRLTHATGTAEPEAALEMLGERPDPGKKTIEGDKNYNTAAFVTASRDIGVTPHVARNINTPRGSNIDRRTTRHKGYRVSQVICKRIEEANGWIKTVGGMAQTKLRGLGLGAHPLDLLRKSALARAGLA